MPPLVDDVHVDASVRRGVEHLRKADTSGSEVSVLYALAKAGVSEDDPTLQKLLAGLLEAPLERTREVALQARSLEAIERVKYRGRILECAQFLVDSENGKGRWGRGEPTFALSGAPFRLPAPMPKELARSGGVRVYDGEARPRPKVVSRVPVRQSCISADPGDPVNSFWAALGLVACHDSGIDFEKPLLERARRAWLEKQSKDGGWGRDDGAPTVTMTALGVASFTAHLYLLGEDWKKNGDVVRAVDRLGAHLASPEESGESDPFAFYAVERAGMHYHTELLGKRWWYPEGVNALLKLQWKDGSWNGSVEDTCYAILFLHRATRSLHGPVPRERR